MPRRDARASRRTTPEPPSFPLLTLEELRERLTTPLGQDLPWGRAKPFRLSEIRPIYRMREEALTLWLSALLSGRFEQGTGRLTVTMLRRNHEPERRHCCLGVLCEAVRTTDRELTAREVRSDTDPSEHGFGEVRGARVEVTIYGTESGESYLPPEVSTWANLHHNPTVEVGGWRTLASVNDNLLPFESVARLIWYVYGPDAPEFDPTNPDHREARGLPLSSDEDDDDRGDQPGDEYDGLTPQETTDDE